MNDSFFQGLFAWGDSLTAYTPHAGLAQVGANTRAQRSSSNLWCAEMVTTDNVSDVVFGRRVLRYCPYLNTATSPGRFGDGSSRVLWVSIRVLAGTDAVAGVADRVGVSFVPDNGLNFAGGAYAAWLPLTSGGFGIYKRAGTSLWRYASYSAAPALLEATNLPSANGWHVADFIIRQARQGDATTPWLTFQWDGVDIFTRRVFGDPLLPAPTTIRALAQSWAFLLGNIQSSGALNCSWSARCGARMPDGTAVND